MRCVGQLGEGSLWSLTAWPRGRDQKVCMVQKPSQRYRPYMKKKNSCKNLSLFGQLYLQTHFMMGQGRRNHPLSLKSTDKNILCINIFFKPSALIIKSEGNVLQGRTLYKLSIWQAEAESVLYNLCKYKMEELPLSNPTSQIIRINLFRSSASHLIWSIHCTP